MRNIVVLAVLFALTLVSGCASMCDSSYDCDYHAFGGMRDRIDRKNGRVGSIFDPAQAHAGIVPPQAELPPEQKPFDPDEESTSDDSTNDEDPSNLEGMLDSLNELEDLPTIPNSSDEAADTTGLDVEI